MVTSSLPALAAVVAGAIAIAHLAFCIFAIGVLPGNRKPSTAMAWLILILAVPLVGAIAFLLFGSTTVGRRRRAWQREVNEMVMRSARDEALDEQPGSQTPLQGLTTLNRNLGSLPLVQDNCVEIVTDYAASIEAMRQDVAVAQQYVHVQFYISAWDATTSGLFDELVRATERGVTVRLLYDHLGSRGIPAYREFVERLASTAIHSAPMLPIAPLKGQLRRPDLRNHRKILVVDGRLAFTGSQNLIEPGYNKPKNHARGRAWVELMLRVHGPVVHQLDVLFATDWFSETGEDLRTQLEPTPGASPRAPSEVAGVACQVVPSGPGFVTENNLRLFNSLVYSARSRVSLTSPYFVPDESLLYAVTTAAQRGVEVELFVSAEADQFMVHHAQRSYYQALLEAGIRIWLYPSPAVLHAKHLTVDDTLALVGSSNMDMRSFALNYEVVVMLHSADVVKSLERVQDDYRSLSTELTQSQWRGRTRRSAYVDNVMRLTAALQ